MDNNNNKLSNLSKWEDNELIDINLNSKNKLKKLKKSNEENKISFKDYQTRIGEQYNKMINLTTNSNNIYKWAENIDLNLNNNDENDIEKLLKSNQILLNEKKILNSTKLKISQNPQKIKINDNQHKSIITSLNFHPYIDNILITTGLDKNLKIFKIDNQFNDYKINLLNNINSVDMPIFSSNFLNNEEIIFTGRRKYYFIYNINSNKLNKFNGTLATSNNKIKSLEKCFVNILINTYAFGDNYGNLFLYDSKNKQFKYDIKVPSTINSICFDNIYIYVIGDQSEIFIYDSRKYKNCVGKINDFGNYYTNCMDITNDYNYLATGSKNGYVNLYKLDDIKNSNNEDVEPIKIFQNLTTSVDYIRFNKNSNLLGMSSKWKKNAFRLVNLDNMKVYQNFPSYKEHFKYPFCFDFNSSNNYLSIGNDEGKSFLFNYEI
jgi:U3 small nucleolar RNA-associated protein 18